MPDVQKDRLVCPKCQHENESGAQQCAKCGSSLVITVPVPPSAPEKGSLVKTEPQPIEMAGLLPNTLTLLVAGYTEPAVVPIQSEVLLGRSVPGEAEPTVDLSKYNGHMLGVSRHHAKIVKTANGFTVEDLSSANGTWLNENRLQPHTPRPLRGGDQIRMGHLITFVYFTAVDMVVLADPAGMRGVRNKLTPRELTTTVGPFLVALTEIQQVVNTMQGRPQPDCSIKSINMMADNSLQVKLEGVSDALKLVREQVMPWKKEHAELIAQFKGASPFAQTMTLTEDERKQNEEQWASFRSVEGHLAKALVGRLAPQSPASEQAGHAERLVAPLEAVIMSGLEIVDHSTG